MAVKNILVSYNAMGGADAALALAALLARTHDAHLTGLLSWGPSRLSAALGPWVPRDLMDAVREAERERRDEIARAFEERTRDLSRERPGKVHWLDLGGDADESLMEAARVYDLVVMGRFEATMETAHLAPRPDQIALESGKPVLIVPKGCRTDRVADRAVVAWDGGRAAARALSEAMALIEHHSRVCVATVGEAPGAVRQEGRDVVAHLARHGIRTEWTPLEPGRGGVARALLRAVEDAGAGLLVMGAYEHSRISEMLVGGVTRTILEEMTVPVLMAH